jgi:holo-[acyl-carrier protein] synthase
VFFVAKKRLVSSRLLRLFAAITNLKFLMLPDLDTLRTAPPPPIPLPAIPQGGALIGIGADIVDIARIRAAHERHAAPFLDRVFTPDEIAYCLRMANPYPHLAARFAAKEAVAKAFATGIGAELGWHSIAIYHGPRQEPLIRLDEKATALLARAGATRVLITLSHTASTALAVAALVRAS